MKPPVVGFLDEDYARVSLPHIDALVIMLQVANHIIHRIFVDNRSSTDILYWSAFTHMDISRDKIVPSRYPLMGFAREQVQPVSSIELPVTTGDHSRQKTIMVKFRVIGHPSAYNAILGRTALNKLKAVTSTSHLNMKFLNEHEVGKVKGRPMDVFAWSLEDMLGIDPSVLTHRLNVNPSHRPIKQKRRSFTPDKNEAMSKEVEKLLQAGFIREVDYPD
ncbi:uncharacterized protein LOC133873245 [Alnus glutinosa]|uniref:uncharacterized protein LOC133873245 n=1 Tax=Alnus glutinosa TaxID=3517 RepID=UPI002D768E6B|nr:uncharacterized protein LOC133873245 [Alnus glutinosa]